MNTEQGRSQKETHEDASADKAKPSPPGPVWTSEYNPWTLTASAIESNSISGLREALALTRAFLSDSGDEYIQFRDEVFRSTMSSHSLALLTYMLDNENAPISAVPPVLICQWASKPLTEALVARGWDINTQDNGAFREKRLIDHLVPERAKMEDMVHWLVEEMGARIDGGQFDPDYRVESRPPPILETCAAFGAVPMFKYLEEKGAKHSRRMLHVAVAAAAGIGADPNSNTPAHDRNATSKNSRIEMLRYLVDERRLDVNGMDATVSHKFANTHWGTPICYAARWPKGAPVVKWLLKKGADPTLKDLYPRMDATACAREEKCDEVLEVLENWKQTRNEGSD
ncbi:hypothetical protein F4779DRAFT_617025 [Xylariaceae sp. FL0662B]|nr:hypothetical protein F4779DRAFT_617025 [Xylariaceae sp. FL0662B]